MTNPDGTAGRTPLDWGIWLLAIAALLGLLVIIFEELNRANGIHGTEGLLLVLVSTALMLIAALVIAFWARAGWPHGILAVLIFLDIIGTAAAAYLLESYLLLALMAVAFIGWLGHLVRGRTRRVAVAEVAP